MDQRAKDLLSQSEKMFSGRGALVSYWQELADQFYPERRDITRVITPGSEMANHMMESYPIIARRELGNTLSSMLRPRSRQWFHSRIGREEFDDRTDVKRWYEHIDRAMYRAIYDPKAQFIRATKATDHDWVTFGNGVISYEESPTRDHLLFRNWHIRDNAWVEGPDGTVNRNDRKMKMTARNMLRRWKDKIDPKIEEAARKDPNCEYDVRHIVLPTDEYDLYASSKTKEGKNTLPWTSIYIDVQHESILQEGGLHEFGYVIPRWHLISGCQYGFSLATTAGLSDARMLQQIARIVLENAEKAVDPPLTATEGAVRGDINIFAGGVTWVDREYDERSGKALEPLAINGDVRLGVELQQSIRSMIAEAFFLNKLMIPAQGDMTAYETQVRVEEYIRGALPLFEPVEVDYNAPLLDGVFSMLARNGTFDKSLQPDDLAGREFSFVFDSPIQSNEKTLKVASFQQVAQISSLAAQIDPDVPKQIDWKQASKDAMEGAGASADWFVSEEDQKAAAEAGQQMQSAQSIAALLGGGADVAGKVADATIRMKDAGLA